jgi:hypothetical protein
MARPDRSGRAMTGFDISVSCRISDRRPRDMQCEWEPSMKKSRLDLRTKTPVRKLTREEMITLVDKIQRCEGTEEEIDAAVELFQANCLHPSGSDLIFWPHGFPHHPNLPEPTTEEIVDKALSTDHIIKL